MFDAIGPLADAGVSIEPRVDAAALIVAGIAGLACLVGLVLPAFASGRGLAAERQTVGRQGNRTLAQRLGVDLALVILAVIGLWQLRQYGAPLTATVRGSVGLDPLLVAAPAIGLLAGAILALRIVPLIAELAERLFGTRRGLVAPLGARQLARRPLRYTRSALLLTLAAALGTFAAAYTTTWTQSQADQAAYQTGGDLRVEVSSFPDLPLWAFGAAYGGVEGVAATAAVVSDTFDVSGASGGGQLLATDTGTLPEVADVQAGPARGPQPRGARDAPVARSRGVRAHPAAGDPGRRRGRRRYRPREPSRGGRGRKHVFAGPFPETLLVGTLSIAIRDRAGLLHVIDAPAQLQAAVAGQRIEVSLTDELSTGLIATPDYPLDLVGIQLLLQPPADTRIAGTVEVTSVAVHDAAGASTDLELEPSRDGWSWLVERGLNPAVPAPTVAGSPGVVAFTEEQPIYGDEGPVELRLVPDSLAEVADRPLPIVVSRSFIDATRSNVGDSVAIGSLTRRTQVEIAAIVDAFPTLDPERPFAVLDVGGYALSTYARNGEDLFADEWWLAVTDEPAAVATLADEPYSVETLLSRTELTAQLTDDPVALGVIGALAIGSIASLIVAVIGFVVSSVVSTRERLGEFALLRALGLSPAQLSAWLTMENAFLLTAGVVAGTGLGLVLSWLVLPFVTLTADARVVVPPVLVEIPWPAIGFVFLMAVVALVATVIVIGAILRRVPVSGVLRAGQD